MIFLHVFLHEFQSDEQVNLMDVPSGEPPESPTIESAPFAAARDPLGSSANADENSAIPRSRSFSTAFRPSSATSAAASSDGLGANSGSGLPAARSRSRNWSGGSASGGGADGGSGAGETTDLSASDGAARSPRSPLRLPGVPVRAAVGRWRGDVEVQRTRVYNQHVLLN